MELNSFVKKHQKKIIIGISIIIFMLLFSIIALPAIIRPIVEKQLTNAFERSVKIGKLHLNPLLLSIQIDNFSMSEKNAARQFVSFDRLYINLQSISIFKRGLIVKALQLDNPIICVERNLDSTYNFSDLLKPNEKKDTSEFKFSINNIRLNGGQIKISDLPAGAHHDLKNIELSLPFISNLDYYTNIYCTPSFSAIVNGTPFELKGRTKPFEKSMETEIALRLDKIDIAKYLGYVPQKLNFKLNSALISVDGKCLFMIKPDKKPFFEYKGKLSINNVNLTDNKDSLIISFPSLDLNVNSAEIVSSSINLKSVVINSPVLNVRRERDGKFSLLNLLPQSDTPKAKTPAVKEKQAVSAFHFTLEHFALEQGKVFFTDNIFSRPFRDEIDSINFSISNLNLKQGCNYTFNIVNRQVERINSEGDIIFEPLSAKGKLRIAGLEPKFYSSYFPSDLNIELKNGVIDFETGYDFKIVDNKNDISINQGVVNIRDLSVWQKSVKEELFRNKRTALSGLNFNMNQNTLSVDNITTDNAKINIKRLSDGNLNFTALTTSPKDSSRDSAELVNKETADKPFLYSVKSLKINSYSVLFEDQSTIDRTNLEINKINLSLANLSNHKHRKTKVNFSAAVKPQGNLRADGTITMEPLSSSMNLDLKNFPLKPVQGYIADQLNITLTGGLLSAFGKFTFAQNADTTIDAGYKGDVEVNDFATINTENVDNFILLKALRLKGMDFSLTPLNVNINEITVSELNTIFNIYADGTTNLQKILKKDTSKQEPMQGPASVNEKPEDKENIRIDAVLLDNCNINFSDYRFRNLFSANMKNLNGKITGLSSEQDIMADVAVDGKYDATSPITIAGKINPLAKNLFVDIGLNFKDIDLTQMNPYSQKYLGYAIRKGKLSLDLKYLVKDNKLDSKNNIFMDQLTLGEAVESSDATKLPVKFALALLRDRNGDIKLNVPVTGSLDDPKFNIGKLLLQVLGNIITKAVTSPFSALGALFGGKEELSYLEFEPGKSSFSSQSIEKLEKISSGLNAKNELNIEIHGFADINKDRVGLIEQNFQHKIKAAKLKDLLKRSDNNISIDSVIIQPEEYEKYLKKAYESERFEKPKTKLGFTKALQVPEMEKLIHQNIIINDDDLKVLANSRVLKVKDYLVNIKKVNTTRVFLIESKNISPESKPDVKDSRVEFVLKAE